MSATNSTAKAPVAKVALKNEILDAKNFDQGYFDNYSDEGKYEEAFALHTAPSEDLKSILHSPVVDLVAPKSVLDLGAANGLPLVALKKVLPSLSELHGIEISKYAVERKVLPTIYEGDVRAAQQILAENGAPTKDYDIVLSNVTQYLDLQSITDLITTVSKRLLAKEGVFCHVAMDAPHYGAGQYKAFGYSQHPGDTSPIICRNKRWWRKTIEKAGGMMCVGSAGEGQVFVKLFPVERNLRKFQLTVDYCQDAGRFGAKGKAMPLQARVHLEEFVYVDLFFSLQDVNGIMAWKEYNPSKTFQDMHPILKTEVYAQLIERFASGEFYHRAVFFAPMKKAMSCGGGFVGKEKGRYVLSSDLQELEGML